MLYIKDVTIEQIENGGLIKDLPEIYELKKIIENNNSHTDDIVFVHTLNVVKELGKLTVQVNRSVAKYLNECITKYKKNELLFLAALFHDIAKFDTYSVADGKTVFPDHEAAGALKAGPILDRFDLSAAEKTLVLEYIKNHGTLHAMIDPKNPSMVEQFQKFKYEYPQIWLGEVLLCYADNLGSQLRTKHPDVFNFKEDFYTKTLNNFYAI